jgi:hypothetical protein
MKNLMPVYNEIARIPLIVHLPGSHRGGTRVGALTQTTDLMPTVLDYCGAPRPPHLHGVSLRPVLEAGEAVHDALLYGYFGMALNATDGRYTYFRNPVTRENLVHAYTAMPTAFHSFMPREQLAQAEMGRFLGHTYNIPVYKVPQRGLHPLGQARQGGASGDGPLHELFDLAVDPAQDHPLADDALEQRFCALLREQLARVQAPPEHLARLGLS